MTPNEEYVNQKYKDLNFSMYQNKLLFGILVKNGYDEHAILNGIIQHWEGIFVNKRGVEKRIPTTEMNLLDAINDCCYKYQSFTGESYEKDFRGIEAKSLHRA